ncbi:MAG: hypothetical protein LBU23_13595 [Planctomycetota bacterium]|jgi:hypothetical protein|nr:hypothetical protein [Planctomycetota bacterium]
MREFPLFPSRSRGAPAPAHAAGHDPAWRWQAGLALALGRPVGKGGWETAAALEDPLLRDRLLPYLRFRVEGSYQPGIPESDYLAIRKAVNVWSDREREYRQLPYRLEAGVLAGRPEGCLTSRDEGIDGLAQRLYEGLFFDVRAHLDDREWLLRAVFAQPGPRTQAAACGLRSKVVAYGLGGAELRAFRDGSPSARALHLIGRLDLTLRYLDGIGALGLFHPDDMVNSFRRLFQEADRVRAAPDSLDGYDLPVGMLPNWRERLAELELTIPSPARPPKAKRERTGQAKDLPGEAAISPKPVRTAGFPPGAGTSRQPGVIR